MPCKPEYDNRPCARAMVWVAACALLAPAAAETPPALSGVWFSPLLAPDDARWRMVDVVCARVWCSKAAYEFLEQALSDRANDSRPLKALDAEMRKFNADHIGSLLTPAAAAQLAAYDPSKQAALDCKPDGDGWHHQVLAPPPTAIEQHADRVEFRYEYWNAARTVYLDPARAPEPGPPSRLGYSTGRYEGDTLVVETTHLLPGNISVAGRAVTHGPEARMIERYTPSANGERLDLEWSVVDPTIFRAPLVGTSSYLAYPDAQLEHFECEAITGEF